MPVFNGTPGSDTIQGSNTEDTINGGAGNDLISGEGLSDSIVGGSGNDTIYGDAGEGTAPGSDASPIDLSLSNVRPGSYTAFSANNAQPGDSIIYDEVAELDDGTVIAARLILVSTTNSNLNVNLAGGNGAEILLNSGFGSVPAGEQATFRLEFYNQATGAPIALNSTATFNDLDRNSPGDQEAVILEDGSFTNYGTAPGTSLNVVTGPGSVRAEGTENNTPADPDAWFSASFENREFIEFSLESRSTPSGFTMSGDLIPDVVVVPIEDGNDTIIGGEGDDVILGQGGNDSISTGTGDDSVEGGDGEDTIDVGTGTDTVDGGNNSDRFVITGAGDHTITGGEDADGSDIDVIDLSGINARVIKVGPESGTIEFLDASGAVINTAFYSQIEQVICFTPGTQICTDRGMVAVEELHQGDRVVTRDDGLQELAWIGRKDLGLGQLIASPDLAPVTIQAGALGNGLPETTLTVSPNHRILFANEVNRMLFDEAETLVAAKNLVGRPGITQSVPNQTSYIHLMFEAHQLVLSNGCWTESFLPATHALAGIEGGQRDELLTLFPQLRFAEEREKFIAARRSLKSFETQTLLDQL